MGILLDALRAGAILMRIRRYAGATKHAPGVIELKRFYLETAARSRSHLEV